MPKAGFDVIVIGCGGFGSATLSHLSRRGLKVLGIDQYHPPHDQGSSHGETRVIRKAYFEHPDYVPLLHRAYQLWDELQDQTAASPASNQRDLFVRCGLLLAGPADGEVITGVRKAASLHSLQIEHPDRVELVSRFPGISVPTELDVVFEPDAGFLWVERCVQAHLDIAAIHGATLLVDESVLDLQIEPTCVQVRTAAGTYSAAQLVLTAGAWTGRLLTRYAGLIRIKRKTLFWYPVSGPIPDDPADSPIHLMEFHDGRQFYGFPSADGQTVKLAEHTGGIFVDDPATIERTVATDESAAVDAYAASCLVGVKPEPVRSAVCMYSMSPDGHFLVDRLADLPIVVAAGFSGHGFKFTSVLGEVVADLIQSGKTSLPIGFLSANRIPQVDSSLLDLS